MPLLFVGPVGFLVFLMQLVIGLFALRLVAAHFSQTNAGKGLASIVL